MSGSAFLAADPAKAERMTRFANAIAGWVRSEQLQAANAAHRLGVGRPFLGDVMRAQMDPLSVAPSTAMRIIQVTGLTATYLGFESDERLPETSGGSGSAGEGSKPPFANGGGPAGAPSAVGAPATDPHAVGGAPFVFRRPGSAIGAWYEVPGTVVLHLGATDTRLGELTSRLSIDDCDHAIAALTQAVGAARRAKARADFYREA